MKLFDGGRAPNPRRVKVFLAEKGITVPTEQVDLGKLPQQLVIEGDTGAGGGGEALAGLADALGGKPPALGQGLFARHGNVAVCCYAHNTPYQSQPSENGLNSRKILKGDLKQRTNRKVNEG